MPNAHRGSSQVRMSALLVSLPCTANSGMTENKNLGRCRTKQQLSSCPIPGFPGQPHLSCSIPGATGDPPQLGGLRAGSPSLLLPPPSALAAASGQGPCCVPQAGTKHSLELPLRHTWARPEEQTGGVGNRAGNQGR